MGSYKEARARPIHAGEDKGCYRLLMKAKGWGSRVSAGPLVSGVNDSEVELRKQGRHRTLPC